MKGKISLLLALVLVAIPLSFSHAETNDYTRDLEKLEKYASEIDNHITDLICNDSQVLNNGYIDGNENNNIKPSYVEHHNCFRGGTSCADCYSDTLSKSCGCFYVYNFCCCGARMSTSVLYCKMHKR